MQIKQHTAPVSRKLTLNHATYILCLDHNIPAIFGKYINQHS